MDGKIIPHHCALGKQNGKVKIIEKGALSYVSIENGAGLDEVPLYKLDDKIDTANLMKIDVEGYEMKVLKGFDFKKYSPDLVLIEYVWTMDTHKKKIGFHNQNIQRILNSELYNFMSLNQYSLVNWLHTDLVFVANKIQNNW